MNNLREQERVETLDQVNDVLSVLNELNELYIYAVNINEQLKAARSLAIQSSKQRTLKTYKQSGKIEKDFYASGDSKLIAEMVLIFACFGGVYAYFNRYWVWTIICIVLLLWAVYRIYKLTVKKNMKQCVCRIVAEPLKNLSSQEESSYSDDIKEISKAITQTTTRSKSILAYIPRDYRNYDAVAYFERVLANKRAYTMQEAINLYEQHLYKLRVEDSNRQLLEQAQKQTRLLRDIEFNTDFATTYMIMRDILG